MSIDSEIEVLRRRVAIGAPGAAERLALAEARAGRTEPPMRWPVILTDKRSHLWIRGVRLHWRPGKKVEWLVGSRTACGRSEVGGVGRSSEAPDCARCRATFAFKYIRARGWHPVAEKKRMIDARVPEALRRWVERNLRADAEDQEDTDANRR